MKIGTRILAGYLAAIVVFSVVGAIAYKANQDLVTANSWVAHSYQVRHGLAEILLGLVNAETGQRGYLLTGDARFLEPYQLGERNASASIQQVRNLITD